MTALLEIAELSKAYRGIHAVRDASFRVEQGTITGLIGPNGSGKTTTIDCITGFQRSDAGRVRLGDADISQLLPQQIARAGLLRTFQTVRVYDEFDLLQNLLVIAAPFTGITAPDMLLRRRRFREAQRCAEARARDAIELVGLTALIDAPAAVLSYGQKKLLALAATMMATPKLIILDEPVAGVNPTRVNEIAALLRRINRNGTTFLIVEHNVEFIARICDHVLVLDQGRLLTEGSPKTVREDARVLDAYLGRERESPACGDRHMTAPLLELIALTAGYGDVPIVRNFDLRLQPATITTLIGGNGAGKSTLLKAIYGSCRWFSGEVVFAGEPIERRDPWERLKLGIGFVPQGRCNFPLMSVAENLKVACYTLPQRAHASAVERVTALFPVLRQRWSVSAGNLSGGEQQLLEMAMVLATSPKLLLLDEPSLGLAPKTQAQVFDSVQEIAAAGVTCLIVEQNVHGALLISQMAVVMELGRKFMEGPAEIVRHDPRIREAYLGGNIKEAESV